MKKKVVIFGASTRGIAALKKLEGTHKIIAFADNDSKKWGKKLNDIEIINPKELLDLNVEIIVASEYYNEIIGQLKNMNLHNYIKYESSIESVIYKLLKKGVIMNRISALETFGGSGKSVEQFYVDKVKSLDIWEIDERFEGCLKKNLPGANIKITDSFKEIRITEKKFNMIIMDNPMGQFENHCEHFDMFLEIFRVIQDECIVILDIMPNLNGIDEKFKYIKSDEHLLARKLFYRTTDPLYISIDIIIKTYSDIANVNGFKVEWSFTEERSGDFIQYLVLKLKRN